MATPLQLSWLANSTDRGSLAGYSPWGRKESDRTHTHTHTPTHTHTHTEVGGMGMKQEKLPEKVSRFGV